MRGDWSSRHWTEPSDDGGRRLRVAFRNVCVEHGSRSSSYGLDMGAQSFCLTEAIAIEVSRDWSISDHSIGRDRYKRGNNIGQDRLQTRRGEESCRDDVVRKGQA